MPNIQFKSNGLAAFNFINHTKALTGSSSHFKAREELREEILKVWPELEKPETDKDLEKARIEVLIKAIREFTVSPKQQTAIAEGTVVFLKDDKVQDTQKAAALDLMKLCKVSTWVKKQAFEEDTLEDFDHSDEAVILDA